MLIHYDYSGETEFTVYIENIKSTFSDLFNYFNFNLLVMVQIRKVQTREVLEVF